MTRRETLIAIARGVTDDLRDYGFLQSLLEEQFLATLRIETARLHDIAERITALVDVLESRRAQRVTLVAGLLGEGKTMGDVFALLTGPARDTLLANWKQLEELVRQSKEQNARNCSLMMDRHSVLQRVLHGEEEIYAPA